VNQSRPRTLPGDAAGCAAGTVCCDGAADATAPSARRSSRPPSSSRDNVDSPLSPAPPGSYGVGFRPNTLCIGLPLFPVAHLQSKPRHHGPRLDDSRLDDSRLDDLRHDASTPHSHKLKTPKQGEFEKPARVPWVGTKFQSATLDRAWNFAVYLRSRIAAIAFA
jgi:hypothetical protein